MAKNNIIVFGGSKTKKKGTQADQMHGIARCMRQQADLIEKGTKILECEAASYLAEVELDFDEFTLSDNSTNELFQLFIGMVDGKLENKRMYEAVFCSVLEDERYFLDAWVLDDYYDVYVPGSDVSIDFAFSLYKVDKRNQCSFFNREDRAWEHIRAEDVFSEIGLLADEEALISEYQKKFLDFDNPSAWEGENVGKMLMVGSFIDAYGMISDKNVEDALEKNKELNTVFFGEDCRVVHKRNTRGYYSSEGYTCRVPNKCDGIAISYRDGQFRLCQFLEADMLSIMCNAALQRKNFPYEDLIADTSVAIREVWATPDKKKIVAAVKKMSKSEFVVPLSENTWIAIDGEFELSKLQTGYYTKGKRNLGKKEEQNLAYLLKCMEAVEESNVF